MENDKVIQTPVTIQEIENKLEKLKTEKSKLLAELTGSIPEKWAGTVKVFVEWKIIKNVNLKKDILTVKNFARLVIDTLWHIHFDVSAAIRFLEKVEGITRKLL